MALRVIFLFNAVLVFSGCTQAEKLEASQSFPMSLVKTSSSEDAEEAPVIENSDSKDKNPVVFRRSPINSAESLSGKRFFVEFERSKTLSGSEMSKIKKRIEKEMIGLGFERAKSLRKAHVGLHIGSGYSTTSEEEFAGRLKKLDHALKTFLNQIPEDDGNLKDGPPGNANMFISVQGYHYGKRPRTLSWIEFISPEREWTQFEKQLQERLGEQFKFLMVKAPKKNTAMKGDPYCLPRFGYELDEDREVIKEILPDSPAKKSGLRVGDEIIAIDSVPANFETSPEVYENFITVPVKIRRNGKIVRTSIKPAVICGE